jgi:AcrR family transcriptional regulator
MSVSSEEEHRTKRRAQIIEAALKAFSRHGLKETSMDRIVEESGTSKGLLYWYFRNKDELIQAVFKSFFEGFVDARGVMESGTSAADSMNRFVDATISEITRMLRFRPFIQELYVYAFRNKAIKKLAKKEFDVYFNLLKAIIQRGIDEDEFRNIDPAEAANAILSVVEGTSLLFFMGVMEVDLGEQTRAGVKLILEAIKDSKKIYRSDQTAGAKK